MVGPVAFGDPGRAVEAWYNIHGIGTQSPVGYMPVLMGIIGVLLTNSTVGGARSDREAVKIAALAAAGYSMAGVFAIAASDAFPLASGLLLVLVGLVAAIWLGSLLVGSMPIPFFGLATIGGLVGLGIVVLAGAGTVYAIVEPLFRASVIGSLLATATVWVASNIRG